MRERIEELIRLLNLTPTQFANQIGAQRATLQHVLSGRNEPSLKIVTSIHNTFPEVSIEWLLSGSGSPFPKKEPGHPDITDMPLFPGFETPINATAVATVDKNPNPEGVKTQARPRKRINNKDINDNASPSDSSIGKHIKEVVVFFEDGTYQKFLSELKK
ncbi:MAG: helix-turn-helix transcriptional regulator [Bacteroidetes bacterium]|nr:helix-turn-helix transcriptional regulator [Candidatus Colenecus caballi]